MITYMLYEYFVQPSFICYMNILFNPYYRKKDIGNYKIIKNHIIVISMRANTWRMFLKQQKERQYWSNQLVTTPLSSQSLMGHLLRLELNRLNP